MQPRRPLCVGDGMALNGTPQAVGSATGSTGGSTEGFSTGSVSPSTDPQSGQGLTYTISDVAQAVGMHPHTIRKRVKAGKLQATLVDGPNGPEYRIPIDIVHQLAAEVMTERTHAQRGRSRVPPVTLVDAGLGEGSVDSESVTSPASAAESTSETAAPSTDSGSVVATAPAIARAQEMAAYTQRLLEPLHAQLKEQAEEIGRLRAELRQAQTYAQEAQQAAERHVPEQSVTAEAVGHLQAELQQVWRGLAEQTKAAEETGRLKAELEQAQRRVAEVEVTTQEPKREGEAAEELRPWWKFW